jgi:hypothetical protein
VSLLRNRSLAAVLVAELVSLTGSAMTYVALPWFVLVTTGSVLLAIAVGFTAGSLAFAAAVRRGDRPLPDELAPEPA